MRNDAYHFYNDGKFHRQIVFSLLLWGIMLHTLLNSTYSASLSKPIPDAIFNFSVRFNNMNLVLISFRNPIHLYYVLEISKYMFKKVTHIALQQLVVQDKHG